MRYEFVFIIFLVLCSGCDRTTKRMEAYEVHGIDVSHYQSRINWDSVSSEDISFVFAKATEGETMSDSLYLYNWPELKRVGIKRGAYHFFRPTSSGYRQAKNFMDNVSLETGDLPPVLDVEVDDGVSDELAIFRIRTWLEVIELHYKIKPIIYTNLLYYEKYIAGNLDEYPVWIARYSYKEPQLAFNKQWDFWQYGNRGRIKGVTGDVDFNVFYGNHERLESFCLAKESSLSFILDF